MSMHDLVSGVRELPQPSTAAWLLDQLTSLLPVRDVGTLLERADNVKRGADRTFFTAFALLPRLTGKALCPITPLARASAPRLLNDWAPPDLRVDELARLWLLVECCPDVELLLRRLESLFGMADIGEQVTLYRGLALLPDGSRLRARAAEGVRSNMQSVFDAVALDNPYPWRWLSESAFNQLVVKALHVGSPLERIVGLAERDNARLTRMVLDYIDERRSAGRSVPEGVWRHLDPAHAPLRAERPPS